MKPLPGTILLLAVAFIASLVFFRAFKHSEVFGGPQKTGENKPLTNQPVKPLSASPDHQDTEAQAGDSSETPNELQKVQEHIRNEAFLFFEQQFQKPKITKIKQAKMKDDNRLTEFPRPFTLATSRLNKHLITYTIPSRPFYGESETPSGYETTGTAYFLDSAKIYDSENTERFITIARVTTKQVEGKLKTGAGDVDMVISSSKGSCACSNITALYPLFDTVNMSQYGQSYENFDGDFAEKILQHHVLTNKRGDILLSRLASPFFSFLGSNPNEETVRVPVLLSLRKRDGAFHKYYGSSEENNAIAKMYRSLSKEMEDAIDVYNKSPNKYMANTNDDTGNTLGFKFQLDILAGLSHDEAMKGMNDDYEKLTSGLSEADKPSLEGIRGNIFSASF